MTKQASASPATGQFDLCGPLPEPGVTVLEASAGTGKTFAVAALVTRMVAEGVAPLPAILVVTFTRVATSELRDRVRARLASAEEGLARLLETGEPPPNNDALLAQLAGIGPGTTELGRCELEHRHERLTEALANFDAATIATTHGFCQMVLGALGVWGEVAPGAGFLEDPRDLVEEVIDDCFARHLRDHGLPPFSHKEARAIGLEAAKNPRTELWSGHGGKNGHPTSGVRRHFAEQVRDGVSRRLVDANLLTYDAVLARLAEALSDPVRGDAAVRRLSDRYSAVLVDEFQDTDFVQWEVVRRAFASGSTRLVLIGDPKQAIYAFRGADVYAYLAAAREARPENRLTLGENWRSDAGVLAAYDALLLPLQLGHEEIVYRQTVATGPHSASGVRGGPVASPLRLRLVGGSRLGLARGRDGEVHKTSAVNLVARDLAADVVRLLSSGAHVRSAVKRPAAPGAGGHRSSSEALHEGAPEWQPIGPHHVGVLVRKNEQAAAVQDALVSAGVPAVVAGTRNVLRTTAARDWLTLLEALQQPSSRTRAAAAAMSDFFGITAEEVAAGDERAWERTHASLQDWALVLRKGGVAALFAEAAATQSLPARLLRHVQGERRLTDLAHIAELLHEEATRSQLGPAALRTWLARRYEEAGNERNDAEELSRRLDSDSEAVQVLTVHRAKGLEFPVVYCPYLWDSPYERRGEPVFYHDADNDAFRKLDVGESGDPDYEGHSWLAQQEARGEELRLLYVALSRAKHQAVVWWAPARAAKSSALGRVLLCRRGARGELLDPPKKTPSDRDVEAALRRYAAQAPDMLAVELVERPQALRWEPPARRYSPLDLQAMPFARDLDLAWQRLSYTSVTAQAHGSGDAEMVSSEPEDPGTSDEPADALEAAGRAAAAEVRDQGAEESLRSVRSPWATLPAGAAVGTFVHGVLERVDFTARDLGAELSAAVGGVGRSYSGEPGDATALVTALDAAIRTPLGQMVGNLRLRDIARSDRLDELAFELPLAGGDDPDGRVVTEDLARVFSRHVAGDGPLGTYARSLAGPQLQTTWRGYLTGSLDLVFRLGGEGGGQRYFVVDYKTNWLAPPGEELSTWHYRASALEAEMLRSHYPLQALLYMVALHRYLRWRLPGYLPEAHLGGVLYLFLRGMTGPDVPPSATGDPCGVFPWAPPTALVTGISDLFAGTGTGTVPHA